MKSLHSKIALILLLTTLVPLLLATAYASQVASSALYEKVNTESLSSLKTISKSLDGELQRLIAEMEIVTTSREFQHVVNELRGAETDGGRWVALRSMDSLMLGVFGKTFSMAGIYLTLPDGTSYAIQDDYSVELSAISKQSWFQHSGNNQGMLRHCGVVPIGKGKSAAVFGKVLRDVSDRGDLSVIASIHFAVDPQLFRAIPGEQALGTTLFFDMEDHLIAQVGELSAEEGTALYREHAGEILENGSGTCPVTLDGTATVMLYEVSELYRYRLVRVIPRASYTNEISRITRFTFLFSAACVLAVILIAVLVSNNISRPVRRLNQAMKYTEKGNFDIFLPSSRKDEIGQVTRRFNKMVARLKQVFEQTIRDEKMKKELEISALQYQINPHFLYNLMASIRSMALIEGAIETGEMLGSAAKLMKSTIGNAGLLVTLGQELENIEQLLYIQNVCHNGTLRWEYRVAEELRECLIPNLILQPIVENAVFYGTNPMSGIGEIRIGARTEGKALLLTVKDSGPGIPPEKQREIFSPKSQEAHLTHIGLQNSNERIQLNFGREYGVTIQSSGAGTEVIVKLPLQCRESAEESELRL